MTNYNDGEWHGWNGGECPVHPESVIEAVYLMNDNDADSHMVFRNKASEKIWRSPFLFRVIKEHREPRTIWALGAHIFETEEKATAFRDKLVQENPDLGYAAWPITEFSEVLK